jgi:hypothetical protein
MLAFLSSLLPNIFSVYTTYFLMQVRITAAFNKSFTGEVGGRVPATRC